MAERVIAGRYRVDDALPDDIPGSATYAATDTILGRPVRVRMLPSHQSGLLDAARRAALVTDARLERVLDVGTLPDGRGYVINEAMSGPSLLDLLRHSPLSGDQARSIIGEAATAIEMARRRGVHHLALRPSAIHLAKDGRVVVTGLALDANLLGLRLADTVAATVDAGDLVRLLYAALTAQWPWRPDDNVTSSLPAAPDRDGRGWPAPSELVAGVPADLDRICRGLAIGQSPATPGDLVRALEPWGEIRVASPAAAQPLNPPPPPDLSIPLPPAPRSQYAPPQGVTPPPHAALPTVQTPAVPSDPGTSAGRPLWTDQPRTPPVRGPRTDSVPVARKKTMYGGVSGRSSRVVIVSVSVVLLVAVVLGVTSLLSHDGPASADDVVTSTQPEHTSAAPEATAVRPTVPSPSPTPTPSSTLTGTAQIASVTTYDPKDTEGEHEELIANVFDEDPTTEWYTRTYKTPNFGGLKPGVALVVTLAKPSMVESVTIDSASTGGTIEIRAQDKTDPAGGVVLAEGTLSGGEQTFEFTKPQEMSGFVVWIGLLPTASDGSFRMNVSSLGVN